MIRFDNVHYTYPNGTQALCGVQFELPTPSFTFLTGHTGAGKTTLIRLLMAMMRPSSGQLLVGDQNINTIDNTDVPLYRRNIGLVFQDHQLLFDRNVFENIALPLHILGYDKQSIESRVDASLRKVELSHKAKQLPQHLSVGEQQRVCIGRAIVAKPAVLIADEPTGNLDSKLSLQILQLFWDFYSVGTSVLIATHDVNFISRFPDANVLELANGKRVQ